MSSLLASSPPPQMEPTESVRRPAFAFDGDVGSSASVGGAGRGGDGPSAPTGGAPTTIPPPSAAQRPPPISLTPAEVELFETLKAVVADAGNQTTLRVAGGWVRDKLLGGACYDVDIAIDDQLGSLAACWWFRVEGCASRLSPPASPFSPDGHRTPASRSIIVAASMVCAYVSVAVRSILCDRSTI